MLVSTMKFFLSGQLMNLLSIVGLDQDKDHQFSNNPVLLWQNHNLQRIITS